MWYHTICTCKKITVARKTILFRKIHHRIGHTGNRTSENKQTQYLVMPYHHDKYNHPWSPFGLPMTGVGYSESSENFGNETLIDVNDGDDKILLIKRQRDHHYVIIQSSQDDEEKELDYDNMLMDVSETDHGPNKRRRFATSPNGNNTTRQQNSIKVIGLPKPFLNFNNNNIRDTTTTNNNDILCRNTFCTQGSQLGLYKYGCGDDDQTINVTTSVEVEDNLGTTRSNDVSQKDDEVMNAPSTDTNTNPSPIEWWKRPSTGGVGCHGNGITQSLEQEDLSSAMDSAMDTTESDGNDNTSFSSSETSTKSFVACHICQNSFQLPALPVISDVVPVNTILNYFSFKINKPARSSVDNEKMTITYSDDHDERNKRNNNRNINAANPACCSCCDRPSCLDCRRECQKCQKSFCSFCTIARESYSKRSGNTSNTINCNLREFDLPERTASTTTPIEEEGTFCLDCYDDYRY